MAIIDEDFKFAATLVSIAVPAIALSRSFSKLEGNAEKQAADLKAVAEKQVADLKAVAEKQAADLKAVADKQDKVAEKQAADLKAVAEKQSADLKAVANKVDFVMMTQLVAAVVALAVLCTRLFDGKLSPVANALYTSLPHS